jgi:hypothetical protein
MDEWKSFLKAEPIEWLLEKENPSVRYLTLTKVLKRSENDPEVREAKEEIMKIGPIPKILAKQNEEGFWETAENFYTAKYKGTVWQLLVLAELNADKNDLRVKKACEFIVKYSQDVESGGFSVNMSKSIGGGRHSEVIPCLTGNMVWALIRLGLLEDDRVQRGINWITTYQRFDDGEAAPPKGWPYDRLKSCFGRHSCHMGVAKNLKALAEIPESKRSQATKKTIEEAVEYLLVHHIHKKSHDLSHISKPGWLRLGFPLMYQTDILEILGILTSLGFRDQRMREAVDILVSKQDSRGRWKLESSFNDRFAVRIERKNETSKWITLRAVNVLTEFFS